MSTLRYTYKNNANNLHIKLGWWLKQQVVKHNGV